MFSKLTSARRRIYLDNNATTKILPKALEAYNKASTDLFGNPSAEYAEGAEAHKGLEWARAVFSRLLNVAPCTIYFTSCGTEANNLAIRSIMNLAHRNGRDAILTTEIEHSSVANTACAIQGCRQLNIPVDSRGYVDEVAYRRILETKGSKIGMVSVILAQNEIGTLQRIPVLVKILREVLGPHVPFHTDATQALGKYYIDPQVLGVDALTGSAHKFHGPRGVGILYAKNGLILPETSIMTGGGQEHGCRSGTENVPAIFAAAVAFDYMLGDESRWQRRVQYIKGLRDSIMTALLGGIPNLIVNGDPAHGLYNTLSLSLPSMHGHFVRERLDSIGIAVGSGSACSKGKNSATIIAIHSKTKPAEIADKLAHGTIRISLSEFNSEEEVKEFVTAFIRIYQEMKQ